MVFSNNDVLFFKASVKSEKNGPSANRLAVMAGGFRSNLGSLFLHMNVLIWVYIKGVLIGATINVFTELFISIDRDDTDI